MSHKGKNKEGRFLLIQEELAQLCGQVRKTLTNWQQRGFPKPIRKRGPYDLGEVLRWLVVQWREGSKPASIADQEARLTKLRADEKEIKVRLLRGELVERDGALRAVERGISEAKGILQALPNEIRALSPPEMREEAGEAAGRVVETMLKSLEGCKDVEPESANTGLAAGDA